MSRKTNERMPAITLQATASICSANIFSTSTEAERLGKAPGV